MKAVCVVPFGVEEGTELTLDEREFGLLVGQAANFRFFASSTRAEDELGQVLDEWDTEDLDELSPLQVALDESGASDGGRVPVRLSAHVTEIGTLELWFGERDGAGRWKLELSVREDAAATA